MVFMLYFFGYLSIFFSFLIMIGNNPIYSLLYLVLITFFISSIFFILGSCFIGVLETIIYAGAIAVLFILVIMLVKIDLKKKNLFFRVCGNLYNFLFFISMTLLLLILMVQFMSEPNKILIFNKIITKQIGLCLFSKYFFLVEFSSLLLLSSVLLVCFFLKQ